MKKEYRIREVNKSGQVLHFVVEERFTGVRHLLKKGSTTPWQTVMINDLDIEGNHCQRENYHRTLLKAKEFIERLKQPTIKYHY